jgi:hypothetical protein
LGVHLIERIKKLNKFKFNIEIGLNFKIDFSGIYFIDSNLIEINPLHCTYYQRSRTSYSRYTNDYTFAGVMIHEFCHFLTLTYKKSIHTDYFKAFPIDRLRLTDIEDVNTDVDEEIAEVMSLYFLNPYLLRLISEPHYDFFASILKSPTKADEKTFIKYYSMFPAPIKTKLYKKYGINVDFSKKQVVKDVK